MHRARRLRRLALAPGAGLLVGLWLVSTPAAALYKCVQNGKTTFQEQACVDGAKETVIKSNAPEPEAAPAVPPPATADGTGLPPQTDQEKLDALESQRLRREAAYALRDKLTQFSNQQATCESNYGVVFSRNGDANRTITSAVYPQNANDPTTSAAAVRCIARANELQQQLDDLRAQCALRKCQ